MSRANDRSFELDCLAGTWAVVRLPPDAEPPAWLPADGRLVSVTRTAGELSIVAPQETVPNDVVAERGFACLAVRGPLDFAEIGILADLAGALAGAQVSLFALSTFDTDYLLLPQRDLQRGVAALRAAGHAVELPPA